MLSFDDFFNAYPFTVWKSRLKSKSKIEFEKLDLSQEKIQNIIEKITLENKIASFSRKHGISYPSPASPDKYLRDKLYLDPIPTIEELIGLSSNLSTLSKSLIMLSPIPRREKEILRFMLAISAFVPDFFYKNKYSIYKKDSFFRVCQEVVDKFKGFTLDDMKKTIEKLTDYEKIPKNGVSIAYIIFLLKQNRVEQTAPIYKQSNEEDMVTRQLRLINERFPEYALEMENCKNSKERRKVHLHFDGLLRAQNPVF